MSLNLNPDPAFSKKSKSYKKALRVSGAISLVGVGSTFAANITLNSDQNVEFGQGVAQTLSCDDEVFVNPVSYYDNTSGSFRLDYVEVSGLNLIPVGAISGTYNPSNGMYSYADASAVAAHPGQYLDSENNNTWTNTCDQVVLDFKAFTDQAKYSTNTLDGYDSVYLGNETHPNTISSPLFWATGGSTDNPGVTTPIHWDGTGATNWGLNSDVAVVFNNQDSTDNYHNEVYDGNGHVVDSSYANFGSANTSDNQSDNHAFADAISITTPGDVGGTWYVKESSFRFFATGGHHAVSLDRGGYNNSDPIAGAISKITVESMKYFPTDYYLKYNNSGALGKKPS